MIIESQTTAPESNLPTFAAKLKSTRESMGLDRKDVAAQLRLNEKIIMMMEKDRYPSDLPVTFIRGYLRSYGKLLQIPEYDIKKALEPIKPKSVVHNPVTPPKTFKILSSQNLMIFFTYTLCFMLMGLAGIWWYSNPNSNAFLSFLTENISKATSATILHDSSTNGDGVIPVEGAIAENNKTVAPIALTNSNINTPNADAFTSLETNKEINTNDEKESNTTINNTE